MVTIKNGEDLPRFEDILTHREYRLEKNEYYKIVRLVAMKHIHIKTVNDFEPGQSIHCVLLTRGTHTRERRDVTGQIIKKGGKKHLVGFDLMGESSRRSPMFSFGPGTRLILWEEYETYRKILSGDNRNLFHFIGMINWPL